MPRRFVFIGIIGFALGLILGENLSAMWPLVGATMASLLFVVWTRRGFMIFVALALTLIGALRIQHVIQAHNRMAENMIQAVEPLTGLVTNVSEQYGRQNTTLMNLKDDQIDVHGGGQVTSTAILPIGPGDYISVDCRWMPVPSDQQRRSASRGVLAECLNPTTMHRLGPGHDWRAVLARARGGLVDRVDHQYHHPQSDLLAGILFGVQDSMPADLRKNFRATGTSHIVALSGFNVTIIVTLLSGMLTSFLGRRLTVWPTLGLIIGFVIMTGASASVVRAAVMAVIVAIGQQTGRPIAASRILAYTLMLMTAVNPLILRYDLGFQLSFLATLGLVYLSGGLSTRLRWIPEAAELRGNLSSTLAAMAATEPLLLWTFGRFSIVAPLVNMAVLPFIPLIMLTGAIGLLLPVAVPVTDALLRLVLWLITTAASWPFAQAMTPWWVAGGIASLATIVSIRLLYDANTKNLAQ